MTVVGFTDWFANKTLQEIADLAYVGLHYDSPELDGLGGSEIAGGGYGRVLTAFTQPSNRAIWSASDSIFTGLNATRLTHFSVWDSLTSGHMYTCGELPDAAGVVILQGQGYILKAGDIAISIA